jgi:hypothetical protein
MNISPDPWTWIAAICSIAVFSSVFKDNKVYQAAEHIFVGSGAGYALAQAYRNIVIQGWRPVFNDGRWLLIVPLLLGLLLYTRFIKGYEWLSRWSMAVLIGAGAGISIYGVYNSQLLAQIRATMVPLYVAGDSLATFVNAGVFLTPKRRSGFDPLPLRPSDLKRLPRVLFLSACNSHLGC